MPRDLPGTWKPLTARCGGNGANAAVKYRRPRTNVATSADMRLQLHLRTAHHPSAVKTSVCFEVFHASRSAGIDLPPAPMQLKHILPAFLQPIPATRRNSADLRQLVKRASYQPGTPPVRPSTMLRRWSSCRDMEMYP